MIFTRETHPSQVHMLNAQDGDTVLSVVEFTYETLHPSTALIVPIQTNSAITLHEIPQDFFDSIHELVLDNNLPRSVGVPFLQEGVDIRIIENPNMLGIKCADIYINPATLENLLDQCKVGYKYLVIKLPKGKGRVPSIAFSYVPSEYVNLFPTVQAQENGIPLFAYFDCSLYWTTPLGDSTSSALVCKKTTYDAVDLKEYVAAEVRFSGESFKSWLENLPEGAAEFFTCDDEIIGVHYQGVLPNGNIRAHTGRQYTENFDEEEGEDDEDLCDDPDCISCNPTTSEVETKPIVPVPPMVTPNSTADWPGNDKYPIEAQSDIGVRDMRIKELERKLEARPDLAVLAGVLRRIVQNPTATTDAVLNTVEALEAERDEARAQVAALREALIDAGTWFRSDTDQYAKVAATLSDLSAAAAAWRAEVETRAVLRHVLERVPELLKASQADALEDADQFLRSIGYERCTARACNCGSWHMTRDAEELRDARIADDDLAATVEALEAERDEARARADEAETEIERLRAGGCARDQRTTQWCAEAVAERKRADEANARADEAERGCE